jgi:hypothetical protein
VKAHVSGERLLVFDVAVGWSPLCEFLDVPVPAEPFPRINDAPASAGCSRHGGGQRCFPG